MEEGEKILAGTIQDFKKNPTKNLNFTLKNGQLTQIAIFYVQDKFYAIDNSCSHKQALLSEGDIEDLHKTIPDSEGLCVRCPKHRSKFCGGLYFSLVTGKGLTKTPCTVKAYNPDWKLATYSVLVAQEDVYVYVNPTNGVEPSESKDSKFWAGITLEKVEKYNHDCIIVTFTVDAWSISFFKEAKKLGKGRVKLDQFLKQLPFNCWHIDLQDIKKTTVREYTPISSWEDLRDKSKLELIIKLYPDGAMSKILRESPIGTKYLIGPPKITIPPKFFTEFTETTAYAGIAGGTGITPFLQMIKFIENKLTLGEKAPKLTVLYSNKTEKDILYKDELLECENKWGGHIKIYLTLTREDPKYLGVMINPYLFGRVNTELIEQCLPPETHQHIFVSGPEGMWDTLYPLLLEKGYTKSTCTELEA